MTGDCFGLFEWIDRAEEALFYRRPAPAEVLAGLPRVATLQGRPGAYADMFALPDADRHREFRLFTGEAIASNAARRHIAGELALRLLLQFGADRPEFVRAGRQALAGMAERVAAADAQTGTAVGIYCCGACTCAFWRNLAAGHFDRREERLRHGLAELRRCREDNGRWRRFPFHYTLLTLAELDHPDARAELDHARPSLEKQRRATGAEPYAQRRRDLAAHLLADT